MILEDPRSPRPIVPPPEKPSEFKVPSPLPSPPVPPAKKSIGTIQGRVQVVSPRGLTSILSCNLTAEANHIEFFFNNIHSQ